VSVVRADWVFATARVAYALYPQRKHLALRVRLWIDFLKHHYGQADFWAASAG